MAGQFRITKTPSWEIRLRAEMDKLSISERKVASCIVADSQAVLGMGISDIARRSGVSDATVVRLCRTLGYKGLKELKIAIAQERQEEGGAGRQDRSVTVQDQPAD